MHIIYRFSLAVTVGLSLGLLLSFSGALREPVSHDNDIYSTQKEILGAIQKKYMVNCVFINPDTNTFEIPFRS